MSARRDTYLVLFLVFVNSFSFGPVLPLLDIEKDLGRIFPFCTSVHSIPAKAPNHPFEDMPDFDLEVVLVVVRPC